jgi:hypothetical protein
MCAPAWTFWANLTPSFLTAGLAAPAVAGSVAGEAGESELALAEPHAGYVRCQGRDGGWRKRKRRQVGPEVGPTSAFSS